VTAKRFIHVGTGGWGRYWSRTVIPHLLELGIADVPIEWLSEKWNINISQFDLFAAFVAGALVVVLAVLFQKTRIGRALRAVQEDEVAAEAMGVNLTRVKVTAFALGALGAGLGGGLYAHHALFIDPAQFGFTLKHLPHIIREFFTQVRG